jgi:hypothetical protein
MSSNILIEILSDLNKIDKALGLNLKLTVKSNAPNVMVNNEIASEAEGISLVLVDSTRPSIRGPIPCEKLQVVMCRQVAAKRRDAEDDVDDRELCEPTLMVGDAVALFVSSIVKARVEEIYMRTQENKWAEEFLLAQ